MIITEHLRCAFDDAQGEKPEAALLHACIAIDATSKRLYSSEFSSRKRFVRCIRDYYWLIEPMIGVGFNLQETTFDNVTLPRQARPPDFADVVYAVHRNSHAHGDEVPLSFNRSLKKPLQIGLFPVPMVILASLRRMSAGFAAPQGR